MRRYRPKTHAGRDERATRLFEQMSNRHRDQLDRMMKSNTVMFGTGVPEDERRSVNGGTEGPTGSLVACERQKADARQSSFAFPPRVTLLVC